MLRLILGKAGAGKTAAVIEEIRAAVAQRQGGQILLVPEQYSHEAERELCRVCGDSLSLYGGLYSFTSLARRVMQEQGGGAVLTLDKGGRLLCMALALNAVDSRLSLYAGAGHKAELQDLLLSAVDELKSAKVSSAQLEQTVRSCPDSLGDKLHDLALIAEAYDAAVSNGHADPADRLDLLVRQIEDGCFGPETHLYVDGFIDFSRQELAVLEAMLRRDVQMTVCLTVDALESSNEIYALSRTACRRLISAAKAAGREVRLESVSRSGKPAALDYFADEVFRYGPGNFEGPVPIRLLAAESISAECEQAAALVLRLVRDEGCRWRDIAVAVRGFEDYRSTLESVFRYYDIPLFITRRSELMDRPLPALIALAYEIVDTGWDLDDVISYLHTGLAGLNDEDRDLLQNYLFKWQIHGSAWERPGEWRQHPDGYDAEYDENTEAALQKLNVLRHRVADPLLRFRQRGLTAQTAQQHAAVLAAFFEDLKLAEQLDRRANLLEQQGRESLAGEYTQLWDLTVSALEQCAAILGDTPMEMRAFGKLFTQMLSKYDVGLIPVALDRVIAGDFDRMRRRSIRHLFVLGCSDTRLPMGEETAGMFSEAERRRLLEFDIDLGGSEDELWREFSLIYNCLTLPSDSLTLIYSACGPDGEEQRPSIVMNRAADLFHLSIEPADIEDARLSAPAPAMALAAHAFRGGSARAAAAAAWFRESEPVRYARIKSASEQSRGRLGRESVEALYGRRLRLSASRIDKFASCRFAYFCQYGLRAKPYEPAGFTPPEIGTFTHYVLENVAREAAQAGGFPALSDEQVDKLTDRYVENYIQEKLHGFREKSKRFIHLFQRLCKDVRQVVFDTAEELRRSDFHPLDFELDFSNAQDMPPVELGEGEGSLTLTGVADRVDGWIHEDKLYLRVVDYKTGYKKFSLSDIWYGMGLQMLLYLFALKEDGEHRYQYPIVPAGVMYVPARNAMLSLNRTELDKAEQKRGEELRRSGLVLNDSTLIEAWEHGEDKRFIPVKFKSGKASGDALASLEQMSLLSSHIRESLTEMARELGSGSITADPYYRTQQENACRNCDFYDACHFAEGENDEHSRYLPKLPDSKVWDMLGKEAAHGEN